MDEIIIQYQNTLAVPFSRIQRSALSFDHAGLAGRPGIDLVTRKRGYPASCLISPAEHVRLLEDAGRISTGGSLIGVTMRNAFQNPRSPVWSREHGICQRAGELVECSKRPYFGMGFAEDGRLVPLTVDFRDGGPADLEYWLGGTPVLWDDRVLEVAEIATEVGDFCHLHQFKTDAAHRMSEQSLAQYERLAHVFEEHLYSEASTASAAIMAATPDGIPSENSYLHNCIGAGPHGMVIVLAHGSLRDVGALARSSGATHAIVVDNGGSPQISLRRPGKELRPIWESHYWRAPTIAYAVFEVELDAGNGDRLPIIGKSSVPGMAR